MPLTRVKLDKFTVFDKLDLKLSLGMNVFIGANGSGKTHLMKVMYAACDISTNKRLDFAEKLVRVFLPSDDAIGRLVRRKKESSRSVIEISSDHSKLKISFSNHTVMSKKATIHGAQKWADNSIQSAYIPVKEMLANAPGFRSLYSQSSIHFEEIYADIVDRAFLPAKRGRLNNERKRLLENIQKIMDGRVTTKGEEFFLKSRQGNLEFTLLAEGLRKLGLLWLLIQNGTLLEGTVLFWDEPETNLNPKILGPLMEFLLELQRSGTQVFIATHDYVVLKELDLRMKKSDKLLFHSLYRDKSSDGFKCESVADFHQIHPNAVRDTFSDLYDREVERTLGKKK